ncbi:hypothetical protein TSMEX_011235 [Taenia solium]|eukprot:TsM_000295300 transcript=TsM_000295300 gene=TsM_000295300
MHHQPPNQERALNLSILIVSGPAAGSTPGGALPSIPLSFSFATILPPEPKHLKVSRGLPVGKVTLLPPRIVSWHRLWSELGRYLIVFEPLTFAHGQ